MATIISVTLQIVQSEKDKAVNRRQASVQTTIDASPQEAGQQYHASVDLFAHDSGAPDTDIDLPPDPKKLATFSFPGVSPDPLLITVQGGTQTFTLNNFFANDVFNEDAGLDNNSAARADEIYAVVSLAITKGSNLVKNSNIEITTV